MCTGNEDFHQPQCIHPSAFPDPWSPAAGDSRCEATCGKKRGHWFPATGAIPPKIYILGSTLSWLCVFREQLTWVKGSFGGLSSKVFQVRVASPVVWQLRRKTEEVRDIRHCRDSSLGPQESETWRPTVLTLALCASLKRFKHQLRGESDSYKYESPEREEAAAEEWMMIIFFKWRKSSSDCD